MRGSGRIVVLGAGGRVGLGVVGFSERQNCSVLALRRTDCDILDRVNLQREIQSGDVVVNCAGWANVDAAETEIEAAYRLNAVGAENIAATCAAAGAALVHLSTDYVFDGTVTRPLREDDPTASLNVYGRSKIAGEVAVRSQLVQHVILRISRVFGGRGPDFVTTMLTLANARQNARVVDDQIGGPTPMAAAVEAIFTIVQAAGQPSFTNWGTYHFCGAPAVSWYDFAREIFAEYADVEVFSVSTNEYSSAAPRPLYGYFDCSRIEKVFGVRQPLWAPALRAEMRQRRKHLRT